MPTEITRASAPVIGHSRVRDINPLSISPLAAAATVLFVVLHLVSGVMLERPHARPAIEPAALAALDDEVKCLGGAEAAGAVAAERLEPRC